LGVFPTEAFDEVSNVTFWQVAEQLHLMIAAMVRQPDRHALFVYGKDRPRRFRTPQREDPYVKPFDAAEIRQLLLRRQRWGTAEELRAEVHERHQALLGSPVERLDLKT